MPIETVPYDTAEHLKTDEDVAFYIEAVLEEGDPALLRQAIGIVARAQGMAHVSQDMGLTPRRALRIVEGRDPGFDTIVRVLKALGLQLTVKPSVEGAR